eukprot:Pgem_evm1s3516
MDLEIYNSVISSLVELKNGSFDLQLLDNGVPLTNENLFDTCLSICSLMLSQGKFNEEGAKAFSKMLKCQSNFPGCFDTALSFFQYQNLDISYPFMLSVASYLGLQSKIVFLVRKISSSTSLNLDIDCYNSLMREHSRSAGGYMKIQELIAFLPQVDVNPNCWSYTFLIESLANESSKNDDIKAAVIYLERCNVHDFSCYPVLVRALLKSGHYDIVTNLVKKIPKKEKPLLLEVFSILAQFKSDFESVKKNCKILRLIYQKQQLSKPNVNLLHETLFHFFHSRLDLKSTRNLAESVGEESINRTEYSTALIESTFYCYNGYEMIPAKNKVMLHTLVENMELHSVHKFSLRTWQMLKFLVYTPDFYSIKPSHYDYLLRLCSLHGSKDEILCILKTVESQKILFSSQSFLNLVFSSLLKKQPQTVVEHVNQHFMFEKKSFPNNIIPNEEMFGLILFACLVVNDLLLYERMLFVCKEKYEGSSFVNMMLLYGYAVAEDVMMFEFTLAAIKSSKLKISPNNDIYRSFVNLYKNNDDKQSMMLNTLHEIVYDKQLYFELIEVLPLKQLPLVKKQWFYDSISETPRINTLAVRLESCRTVKHRNYALLEKQIIYLHRNSIFTSKQYCDILNRIGRLTFDRANGLFLDILRLGKCDYNIIETFAVICKAHNKVKDCTEMVSALKDRESISSFTYHFFMSCLVNNDYRSNYNEDKDKFQHSHIKFQHRLLKKNYAPSNLDTPKEYNGNIFTNPFPGKKKLVHDGSALDFNEDAGLLFNR